MTLRAYLDAVEQRAQAATPGPWHAWDRGIGYEIHQGAIPSGQTDCGAATCPNLNDEFRDTFKEEDAVFLAHARTDLPRLVTLLRRAVEALEQVKRDGGPRAFACACFESVDRALADLDAEE